MRGWAAALFAVVASLLAFGAATQDRAGDFDFYVLALSWSPTYCELQGQSADRGQCAPGGEAGFTVHGLWPQQENGYPESCASNEPLRVPSPLVADMADIMPRSLVGHQWRKHGACTGLSQADYFKLLRAARQRVVIPDKFASPDADQQVSARAVEQAFVAANPGLSERTIAVSCKSEHLAEVRICLTRSLDFHRCAEVDRRGCQSRRILMPTAG